MLSTPKAPILRAHCCDWSQIYCVLPLRRPSRIAGGPLPFGFPGTAKTPEAYRTSCSHARSVCGHFRSTSRQKWPRAWWKRPASSASMKCDTSSTFHFQWLHPRSRRGPWLPLREGWQDSQGATDFRDPEVHSPRPQLPNGKIIRHATNTTPNRERN